MLMLWMLACGDDHGPQATDPTCTQLTGLTGCDDYAVCCNDDATECWYEYDGKSYDCASPNNCGQAANELVCDSCDFGTTPYLGC